GREALQAGKARRGAGKADAESIARVGAVLGQSLPDECLGLLIDKGFPRELEDTALRLHSAVMQGRIVWSKERLPEDGSVLVREVRSGRMMEAPFTQPEQIHDIDETRAALRQQIDREMSERSAVERRAMASLVGAFVGSNL